MGFKWFIRNFEETIGCLLVSLMTIVITIGVFARAFHISVVWTDELARYSFIWSVFIGAVVAIKRKEHVALDFLLRSLSGKRKAFAHIIIQIALIALFAILFKNGLSFTIASWSVPTTSLEMPTGLVYLSVPFSSFLMMIYTIQDLWKTLRVDFLKKNNPSTIDPERGL